VTPHITETNPFSLGLNEGRLKEVFKTYACKYFTYEKINLIPPFMSSFKIVPKLFHWEDKGAQD